MSRLLTDQEATDFRRIVDDYQPDNEVVNEFKSSNFAVIAGPAGAGKDTLRNNLIQQFPNNYARVLSTTTRPLRKGEVDKVTYHFRSVDEVKDRLLKREFFQCALVHNQQVSCLHIDEIRQLQKGQFGLSILIPKAEEALHIIKNDIKTIFLIPPSFQNLKERINEGRQLKDSEVDRRLKAAAKELEYALRTPRYYCLISDTVDHVVTKTDSFLQEGSRSEKADQQARQVMQQIMLELSHE